VSNSNEKILQAFGLPLPQEADPFEQWAKARGYDTRCIGPEYVSQRTKDAESGWMARARLDKDDALDQSIAH